MRHQTKIEQLEISLRGFKESIPEGEKNILFREKQIKEIEILIRELKGENIDSQTNNE